MKCSICEEMCDCKYGHNAHPVNNGRCCSTCNDTFVIPARLRIAFAMMGKPGDERNPDSPE